jgi:glyoxylase-like metal-dependent hydrolase (beta-lactamase superfamily II)
MGQRLRSAAVQWTVGDVRITKVPEHELPVPLDGLLSDVPPGAADEHPWLEPDFVDDAGNAKLSIHGLVIDTGELRILVDPCAGDMREGMPLPPLPSPFLENLEAAGYAPEDIDVVLCTHLHFDHVGWNTRLVDGEWVPTFTNARYLFARVEWEHWSTTEGYYRNVDDTVRPVIEAGAADLVEADHFVCDEVRLVPTPGHTPGHVAVVIESAGERAAITGDLAHHPLQVARPEITMPADSDSPAAVETRRRFLGEQHAAGALLIGTHFGGRTAGRLVPEGGGWRLDVEQV